MSLSITFEEGKLKIIAQTAEADSSKQLNLPPLNLEHILDEDEFKEFAGGIFDAYMDILNAKSKRQPILLVKIGDYSIFFIKQDSTAYDNPEFAGAGNIIRIKRPHPLDSNLTMRDDLPFENGILMELLNRIYEAPDAGSRYIRDPQEEVD